MEDRGLGVHFIVDLDGTIIQLAGLKYAPSHVGLPPKYSGAPNSLVSIGIEVVGWYNPKSKVWDEVPESQAIAVAWLVNSLMFTLDLTTDDIYNHEDIKSKTTGEGAVVRKAIDPHLEDKPKAGK
jgi:N-acetyl-anhydromuramyl-L-alanine amidase AmpD